MNVIFMTQCCVDGCYKKKAKDKGMCKKHQEMYENGEILSINYGTKVQKKKETNNVKSN